MKMQLVVFWVFPMIFCIGCNGKSPERVTLSKGQTGYVLQDEKNNIDIVNDAEGGTITISRGNRVICVVEAVFSGDDERFWISSKLMNDSLYSGGVIIDKYMDGLPDELYLGSDMLKKHEGFSGGLRLGTFIVDDEGNPVVRVRAIDGKLALGN